MLFNSGHLATAVALLRTHGNGKMMQPALDEQQAAAAGQAGRAHPPPAIIFCSVQVSSSSARLGDLTRTANCTQNAPGPRLHLAPHLVAVEHGQVHLRAVSEQADGSAALPWDALIQRGKCRPGVELQLRAAIMRRSMSKQQPTAAQVAGPSEQSRPPDST